MSSLAEIWEKFRARPGATVASLLAVFLFLHFPALLLEHAVAGWINEKIADSLGMSSPSLSHVLSFSINWVLPFIGAAMVMLLYHATQPIAGTAEQIQRQTDNKERSFVPWFMVVTALAIFSIGELVIERPTASIQTDPRVEDILQRLSAVETLSSSLSHNDYAQRLITLEHNDAARYALIKKLLRLSVLNSCVQRITDVESTFDNTSKRARAQIVAPQLGPGSQGSWIAEWTAEIEKIVTVAHLCHRYYTIGLPYEPTLAQIDTKTPGEPTNADIDQLHSIRRLYYQSSKATEVINEVKTSVMLELKIIKDQIEQDDVRAQR